MRATRKTKLARRRLCPCLELSINPKGRRREIVMQAVRRRGFIRICDPAAIWPNEPATVHRICFGQTNPMGPGRPGEPTFESPHLLGRKMSTRSGPQLAPSDPPQVNSIIHRGRAAALACGAAPAAPTRRGSGRRRHQCGLPCAQHPTARRALRAHPREASPEAETTTTSDPRGAIHDGAWDSTQAVKPGMRGPVTTCTRKKRSRQPATCNVLRLATLQHGSTCNTRATGNTSNRENSYRENSNRGAGVATTICPGTMPVRPAALPESAFVPVDQDRVLARVVVDELDRGVGQDAAIPVQVAVDAHRRECRRQGGYRPRKAAGLGRKKAPGMP